MASSERSVSDFLRVKAFMPDGTIVLENGDEMQAVVSSTGALGVRPKVEDDHIASLDQAPLESAQWPPDPRTLGLDQG